MNLDMAAGNTQAPPTPTPGTGGGGGYIRRIIPEEERFYDEDLLPIIRAFMENCVE